MSSTSCLDTVKISEALALLSPARGRFRPHRPKQKLSMMVTVVRRSPDRGVAGPRSLPGHPARYCWDCADFCSVAAACAGVALPEATVCEATPMAC